LLNVSDLKAGYGKIQVLKGVSLGIGAGEIVTLIGANGAGKTTLMRTLCGLLPAMGGRIEYENLPIQGRSAAERVKRGLILVPEGRQILRRMTVYENLLMGAYVRKDQGAVKTHIDEIFLRFPILKERRLLAADVLSGGEQQMLAIGRALLSNPKLLMLDEPSLGLSPILVREIFHIIADLHRAGITIFLVEQNALKALQIADRGYVMEVGRIVMSDNAQVLLNSRELHDAYLGGNEKS
jgi:branched-chain amino acid transport system ATP-binding protein